MDQITKAGKRKMLTSQVEEKIVQYSVEGHWLLSVQGRSAANVNC